MHDKTLAYIAEFRLRGRAPDRVEWHPATASLHFGEYEVDIHPTCVLLFKSVTLMGDVSGRPIDEILEAMK